MDVEVLGFQVFKKAFLIVQIPFEWMAVFPVAEEEREISSFEEQQH